MSHPHKFTRVSVGPPKHYFCEVDGCKAKAEVDPKTKGPGKEIGSVAPANTSKQGSDIK